MGGDGFAEGPEGEEVGSVAAEYPANEDDGVVGWDEARVELDGEGDEAVEGVECVEVETDTCGGIEDVGVEGVLEFVHQCDFDPPEIPVVLPAVEAITWDGCGYIFG